MKEDLAEKSTVKYPPTPFALLGVLFSSPTRRECRLLIYNIEKRRDFFLKQDTIEHNQECF